LKKKYLFISVFLMPLLALSKKAPQDEIVGSYWNYAYQNDFYNLFDQSEALSSEMYQNASSVRREEMLESLFLEKKMNAAWRSLQAPVVFLAAVTASVGVGYYFKIQQYLVFPKINPVIWASTSLSATLAGLTFFFSPIQRFIEYATNTICGVASSFYQFYSGDTFDYLEKYERFYVRKKPNITIDLQNSIEKQLHLARTGVNDFSGEGGEKAAQLGVKLIHNILSLPTESKETFYDRSRFDKIFECYNNDTQTELRRLAVRYIAGQKGQLDAKKYAVYFRGPPGTGKTRAAQLLAKFLDVPYQEISLSGISKKEFVGTRDGGGNPGLVANAMIRVGEKGGAMNFLMLVDEGDRVLNDKSSERSSALLPYMLMYLDPSRNFYYDGFFEANVDKSSMYTVMAGNYEISDEALKNRLHTIPFGAISKECKAKIVWDEYFPQIFSRYQHSKFKLTPEDFTEYDKSKVDQLIESDPDPGMRTIYLQIEKYMADIIVDKLESKI
jgi:ATPase family associated with various cellular activities (AAA)